MAYFKFKTSTGELLEISDDIIDQGSPYTGTSISYIDHTKAELEANYVWDPEIRDFVEKVV